MSSKRAGIFDFCSPLAPGRVPGEMNDVSWCLLFPLSVSYSVLSSIFPMRKPYQKERQTLIWFSGPFWLVQNISFHWDKPLPWNGISEVASDGSFNFDVGNQFQNWHKSPESDGTFCCWLSIRFLSQSMCGYYSTRIVDSDHTFLFSNACRWGALKTMQGGGWYMAQSVYDLWNLFQVQGTVLILPNGLETDLHRTEPSNLLLVCLFPVEHLHHAALFHNHYLLFPFTFHPDFTISVKSMLMSLFSTKAEVLFQCQLFRSNCFYLLSLCGYGT